MNAMDIKTDGFVTSKDGTKIAFTKLGSGPALILVDGALCYRAFGPTKKYAEALSEQFTVYFYDRRGRGESDRTAADSPLREVEDIEALIDEAGGSAFLFGCSSGAALAANAAEELPTKVDKLALYEAPFIVDGTTAPRSDEIDEQYKAFIAEDRSGDAVKLFMNTVGAPKIMTFLMQFTPMWKKLRESGKTLPNDTLALGDTGKGQPLPKDRWSNATMPALVMDGGKSDEWMQNAQRAFAQTLPNATHRTLPGQTHMLKANAIAPVLKEFLV